MNALETKERNVNVAQSELEQGHDPGVKGTVSAVEHGGWDEEGFLFRGVSCERLQDHADCLCRRPSARG